MFLIRLEPSEKFSLAWWSTGKGPSSLILTEEEKELLLLCGGDLGVPEKPKNLTAAVDESSGSGGPGHLSPGGSNKGGMTLRRR